jgi:hypothetical protein
VAPSPSGGGASWSFINNQTKELNPMEITLTIQLSDQDAGAIAKVKHTAPDDVAEIEDHLKGYLEGAIEAAHSQAEQDADTSGEGMAGDAA